VTRTRVLFTIPDLEGGGAERVVVTLLTHLDRARFEPHLALVVRRGPYLSDLPPDVTVHDLGGAGPLALVRLVRLIRRLRPAVVFSSRTFYSSVVLLLKAFAPAGVRFVTRENNLPSVHVPTMTFGAFKRRLYPVAHRRADAVVCQCEEMRDDAARAGVPPERLVVIANPLDLERAAARARDAVRPFPTGGRHLVAAGRLVPAKGFDLLLEALPRVWERVPDATLHLLGEGPEADALRARAERLGAAGRVRLEGFCVDPYPYYRHADLVVVPSRYEGFPNVALEAMAGGTPVVAFDFPGGSPVIEGVNGWRVPAGDTAALGDRIAEVLQAPPLPRSQVAASIAHHDVGKVIAAWERLFAGEAP
jgi:glycosyltransferase involved in cell wall biosynthesis